MKPTGGQLILPSTAAAKQCAPPLNTRAAGRSVLMLFWPRIGRIRNELIFNNLHSKNTQNTRYEGLFSAHLGRVLDVFEYHFRALTKK